MIVYRIQDYLHTTLMRFLYQLFEILCCSKGRVYLVVIRGIILMARI